MSCTQTVWHFACKCIKDREQPEDIPAVKSCSEHRHGKMFCKQPESVVKDVDEDCSDCKAKKEKDKKGESGSKA